MRKGLLALALCLPLALPAQKRAPAIRTHDTLRVGTDANARIVRIPHTTHPDSLRMWIALTNAALKEEQRLKDSVAREDSLKWVRRLSGVRLSRTDRGALVVLASLVGGSLDRDGDFAYQDRYRSPDKATHAFGGASLALLTDDVTLACLAGFAWEVGQMRPSRFPAAGPNRLGRFSGRDAVVTCGGAVVAKGLKWTWRRVSR